jgi:uncharacterized protein (DUF433 family)
VNGVRTLEGLIVIQPGLHKGRPVLAGTGVAVRTVVGHYQLGLTPEEIADDMSLDLAHVYAGLAYYHLNREEIEADIANNSEAAVIRELTSA